VTGTVEALPSAVLYAWRGSLASPEARAGRLSSFPVWRLMLQLSLAHLSPSALATRGPANSPGYLQ
jgi:hypothetical protein